MEYSEYYKELIETAIKDKLDQKAVLKLRDTLCKKYKVKQSPTLIQILIHCNEEQRNKLIKILKSKPTRTLSGVVPIAVMTAPHACSHGKCTFCPRRPKLILR